ncbi:MAG: hypothetical protein ACM3O5_06695 [Betaproteobacteria bacterium]
MRSFRFCAALALLAMAMLSGCATLTTSSSQTVTMTTDPAGAACTFKRDGQVIGVVNPTPGSLSVSKSHTAIDVSCAKEGFIDARGSVGSKFQAMTFGNILFGGIIGIAVDAASGATAEYEPTITIRLIPSEFADAAARDRFFDEQRDSFIVEARKVRARISEMCQPSERGSGAGSMGGASPNCNDQLRLADEEEKSGLARIEVQRQAARIKAP